ncbi:acetylajmalan esterase-like [Apium graveolens]|uniref:acetylajmalan esterase-like n=1 Tax=Apium graveolens TaxID=4045 RepID=UPI003D7B824E
MSLTMKACFYIFMINATFSFLICNAGINNASLKLFKNCKFNKIFQFGDSLSDTGNIAIQAPNEISSRKPYGSMYTYSKPTGRCSNGLLMIDYIAKAAGLSYLHPYMMKNGHFKHGINFAVASSTAMSTEDLAKRNVSVNSKTSNSSLQVQVDWMAQFLASYCKFGPDCENKLKNALFMMGETGGNDINAAIIDKKSDEEIKTLFPEIVETIMNATRRIIKFGARKIVIPGNIPIGCLPVLLAMYETENSAHDKNHCLRRLNYLAVQYNKLLKIETQKLSIENPSIKIVYGDLYNAFEWILSHAPLLGFDRSLLLKACCGAGGKFNVGASNKFCGSKGIPVCSNPNEHVNWDGIHPTQQANKYLSIWLISDILPMLDCPQRLTIKLL